MNKLEIIGTNKKTKKNIMVALAEGLAQQTQRGWVVQLCYPNKRDKKTKHYYDCNTGKDKMYFVYIFSHHRGGWGTDISYTKNWFDKEEDAIKCAVKLAEKYGHPLLKIEKKFYTKKYGRAV